MFVLSPSYIIMCVLRADRVDNACAHSATPTIFACAKDAKIHQLLEHIRAFISLYDLPIR